MHECQNMLPGTGGVRVTKGHDLPFVHSTHEVRDKTVFRPIPTADYIAASCGSNGRPQPLGEGVGSAIALDNHFRSRF
ncbi:Transcriptional regulator of acetoin/glycerol metabolism [Pseudomonas syringae pv. actinidiae]|uniref:Transcriptional regulator of acetoin/glycerol metabolism n=1 Tax=Pseudomonas syringae pv. actinidiae TaxID=103796 RepID=A0A2V0QFQ0_PSESF|nr:Transcriptional regulator of acetoin/glycerol metabolism [Pseudomonas syringae pv. actinidiae]